MTWLRLAQTCDGFSLEDFSREISVYALPLKTAAGGQLPLDTEYLRDQKRGLLETIVRAIRSGIPAFSVAAALVSASLMTATVAKNVVDSIEKKVEAKEAIQIEQMLREMPGFSLPTKLPSSRLPVPQKGEGREHKAPPTIKTTLPTDESKPAARNHVEVASYVAGHEGFIPRAKDIGDGKMTVGVGHVVTGEDRQLFRQLFGADADVEGIMSGRTPISREQAKTLFERDLRKHLAKTESIFPRLAEYPPSVQEALVDGVFRGDLSGSPNTIALIHEGKWAEAAKEYLNHREFLTTKLSGVVDRMRENAKRIGAMAP